MRKHLAIFILLLGCLYAAHSSMAVAAVYRGCCIEDCQGPGTCVDMGCPTCHAPAAVPIEVARPSAPPAPGAVPASPDVKPQNTRSDVWRPPDARPLLT